ncbi:hypothetical protein [Actimicrobium sp. CCI2.3]|uniref:hypothetical protein n=1 Tax=Actimicrobium sp. CCI2.3 TaxID=3048616 RepID=UPI002AB42333|nr:hypothetical protein [Actimicrobium sp. CCI2.3]MDY7574405.1 hypothetical protein [Actimicrobium sp. CCI2.3]MEB0022516.1 hypothetical protein [Actimicrobium sp. CCI2.3]
MKTVLPIVQVWLFVLALVLVFGLVGRLDHDDALAMEAAEEAMRTTPRCRLSRLASSDVPPRAARDNEPDPVPRCAAPDQ